LWAEGTIRVKNLRNDFRSKCGERELPGGRLFLRTKELVRGLHRSQRTDLENARSKMLARQHMCRCAKVTLGPAFESAWRPLDSKKRDYDDADPYH